MGTPKAPKTLAQRFLWRIDFPAKGGHVSIDLRALRDAVELCEALTENGKEPKLYRLDRNEDGIMVARWEWVEGE